MRRCIRTGLDCVHCFINQAQTMCDHLGLDPEHAEDLTRRALASLSAADFTQTPPEIAEKYYDVMRESAGVDDPYAKDKVECNRRMMERVEEFRAFITASSDPFATALKLSVVANAIDFGASDPSAVENAINTLHSTTHPPLEAEAVEELRKAVEEASAILFLADNAGEIVLDKLLIETLPPNKTTVVVRGRPIINDSTMADAEQVGLMDVAPVISNGTGIPGTVVDRGPKEFQEAWGKADLVISKGQGNFETLVGKTDKTCFLLKVKCHVVANALDKEVGELYVGFARNPHFES